MSDSLRCIGPAGRGPGSPVRRAIRSPGFRHRPDGPAAEAPQLNSDMREAINRHFDVVVVVWVLALALGFSMISIAKSPAAGSWDTVPNSGPVWEVSVGN
jgi:hypothetical protein